MLHESEIVDADIDDEAIEVQQFHDVAVGLGPTKLVHVDTSAACGHAQYRTRYACMSTWDR